jgi:WD40 repeat protein
MAMDGSPSGDLLAVGSCGHAIQLWNVAKRTLVRRLELVQECAETLSFSPDGAFLATGAYGCCSTKGLQIWDVRTGNLGRELATASGIRNVAFSGDGSWVAAVDDKGKATVFEWPSGRELRTYEGLEMAGYSGSALIASKEGRYLGWLGNDLRVWDITSGSTVPLVIAPFSENAAFLDDGRIAYISDRDFVMKRLPDGPEQRMALPEMHAAGLADGVAIRRDGLLIGGSAGSQTAVWDVRSGRLRELTAPALTSPAALQWSRSQIVFWADLDSGVQAWDGRMGRPADFGRHLDAAESLSVRPDGALVAAGGLGSIYVLDVAKRRVIASRGLMPAAVTAVAFTPDGLKLAFASSQDLSLFNSRLQPERKLADLEDNLTAVEHVAFSPDGHWVAAGLSLPSLQVWPATQDGMPITLDTDRVTYGPQPPAFSSDSRWLASFRRGREVVIWSTASWNVERSWNLPATGRALAFAPIGPRVAVACDGEGAIWDASTGRKLVPFSVLGSAEMKEIAWSPDGLRVVSSADDGVLRFWNSSDGQLLASLYMFASGGDWLLVTPDGRIDGSERALATAVSWRVGDQVVSDLPLTRRRRVRNLWRSISSPPR